MTYNNVQYLKNNVFLNIKACQHILLHQIIIFEKAPYDPLPFKYLCSRLIKVKYGILSDFSLFLCKI